MEQQEASGQGAPGSPPQVRLGARREPAVAVGQCGLGAGPAVGVLGAALRSARPRHTGSVPAHRSPGGPSRRPGLQGHGRLFRVFHSLFCVVGARLERMRKHSLVSLSCEPFWVPRSCSWKSCDEVRCVLAVNPRLIARFQAECKAISVALLNC